MKLYLVRHGKTEFNQQEIIQGGQVDSPLIAEGIEGAVAAGKSLAEHRFASAYVSPLGRTQQTAELILDQMQQRPEVILEDGLREMFFGDWDGQPIQSIVQHPEYAHLRQFPGEYDPSSFGGESYYEIVERGKQTLEKIAAQHAEQEEVLLVSHGVFITSVARFLTGTPVVELRSKGIVNNTSLTILEVHNGHFSLAAYDEVAHLK